MKLTNTRLTKRKSGMTLLELTVVILVLLSLISILFVGARAWKKGSDRSANILNLRNAQQAVRGHANMNPDATTIDEAIIYGAAGDGVGGYLRKPTPPTGITSYTGGTVAPSVGALWLTAVYTDTSLQPASATYQDW
ncbi:MAG: prepilin-type N-terminal cleavage/methylation domain-containing protein [Verrucomicrobiaceae bacterium]|nr:MAG: prepilin-type N-terminal cleavage/methylation domain-containing protein [Verrucomicrobiaceae bacterium]